MRESVKDKFTWDDLEDKKTFIPCDYCEAIKIFPACNDGATSSACNHCAFNIIDYCRNHDV
jgi:hypothetical protein